MVKSFTDTLKWIARWRSRPVSAWLIASRLYNQGRYREALRHFSDGLKEHPKHPASQEIRLNYSYALFVGGRVVEAIDQLQEAVRINPTYLDAVLKLAHLQSWIGRDSDVVNTVSRGIAQIGASKQLLAMLAISSLRLRVDNGFVEKVLSRAQSLETSDGERGEHLLSIAEAKYSLVNGQIYKGRKALVDLCEKESTSPEALMALSEFLLIEGKVVFARQQLRRALSLVPHQPLVLALLSETYLVEAAGYQPQFALQLALSAVQASNWSGPSALYALAKAYLFAEEPQAALLVLDKARSEMLPALNLYRIGESIDQLREQLNLQLDLTLR